MSEKQNLEAAAQLESAHAAEVKAYDEAVKAHAAMVKAEEEAAAAAVKVTDEAFKAATLCKATDQNLKDALIAAERKVLETCTPAELLAELDARGIDYSLAPTRTLTAKEQLGSRGHPVPTTTTTAAPKGTHPTQPPAHVPPHRGER